jgi:hypothetical protein
VDDLRRTVALSAFDDEAGPPDAGELAAVLGRASRLWDALVRHMAETYPPVTETWNHGGDKFGWSLRLKRKERILLYLTPQMGKFLVGVVLGELACGRAHEERLADAVLEVIDAAPRYGEGRGIRIPVRTDDDLAVALALAALKLGA